MSSPLDPRASRMLALMHEADTEAVTLDELAIAGVDDPAAALLALELAGFTFERVIDQTARDGAVTCVRLARDEAPAPRAPDRRAPTLFVGLGLGLALALLVLAGVRARRR